MVCYCVADARFQVREPLLELLEALEQAEFPLAEFG